MDRERIVNLVRTHQAGTYRYLRFLGADAALAEDLTQEAFLAVLRRDDRAVADAAAYLRAAARNLFFAHCRRARIAGITEDLLAAAEESWANEFLRRDNGVEYIEALRRCLDGLPDRQRRALDMHYRQDKSRADLAAWLDMTEDGVKSLMRRLRQALADCVQRRVAAENR